MHAKQKRLIVGITGATGSIYGIRLLEILREKEGIELHLVITEYAEKTIRYETDYSIQDVKTLADYTYNIDDLSARIASGSFPVDGMVIVPCTVKTMSAIASCFNVNLLIRAADVVLKERRPLIIGLRESPLHLGHIRLMYELAQRGVIIMPLTPVFYTRPRSIKDIVDQTVARILSLLNINCGILKSWEGEER
ncbi:UbiX family flavin prenyltransferase [Candidatus Aerophobetes bacterium]|nr:UbiX family flavin prenyltransferase [Candidatus Aerophobetes bacterium]